MHYFTLKKNSEYIHRELKEHEKINDVCESLKEFKNTNEIYEFYKRTTEMNEIQSLKNNEYCWADIARATKICQKYDIES